MGRAPCRARQYFTTPRKTPSASRKLAKCKACRDARDYDPDTAATPQEIAIRADTMQRHLAGCKHAQRSVRQAAVKHLSKTKRKLEFQQLLGQYQAQAQVQDQGDESDVELPAWTPEQVVEFQCLLVEFQHDNLLPDTFIEKPSTHRFLEALNTNTIEHRPSRHVLGKRLLREQATKAINADAIALRTKQTLTGGCVNLLTDGWQNIAKQHLLGCQLTLFDAIHTVGLLPCGPRHDGLAIAREDDVLIRGLLGDGWNVGSMITDNAGQYARARRILALRWPRLVFAHCLDHAINNLVNSVLNSCFRTVSRQAASAVVTMNKSSGKSRTPMSGWCERLKLFWAEHHSRRDFPASLQVFGQRVFWAKLKVAEAINQPLAAAAHRLQREENTFADAVRTFRELFEGFEKSAVYTTELIDCLESRWSEVDQLLALLAYFVSPKTMLDAFALAASSRIPWTLFSDFAVFAYRRFKGEDYGGLRGDVMEHYQRVLTKVDPKGYKDPVSYWLHVKAEGRATKLPDLAIHVLSIAVNTATCERYFSELGHIHTAVSNRHGSDKAGQIQAIRKKVRIEDQKVVAAGFVNKIVDPTHRTRVVHIDEDAEDSVNSQESTATDLAVDSDSDTEAEDAIMDEVLEDADLEESVTSTFQFWDELLDEVFDADTEEEYRRSATRSRAEAEETARARTLRNAVDPEEPIPEPTTDAFPTGLDLRFPQYHPTGIRSWSISLRELFSAPPTP